MSRVRALIERNVSTKQALDQAQANYDRDRAALDNVTRQIEVARLSGRREDIDAARSSVEQAKAQLANAQRDLTRYANLMRSDYASRQQVDTQTAMVGQLQANIQGDEAAIATARLNLDFTNITAPIDGRVGLRLVDPGNLIHATDQTGIVTIAQIHPIAVVFTLPQDNLPSIQDAMEKQMRADRDKRAIILAAEGQREAAIKTASTLIGQAVCVGDARPYNVALITLDPDAAPVFAEQHGIPERSPAALARDPQVLAEIEAGIERANARLARVEQIKRFKVLGCDWPPAGDELTPTMKLKRKPITEKYRAEIEALYAADR